MKRFCTATLSHDELRSLIWVGLDQAYPGQSGQFGSWPMLVDVYDGFCLAKCSVNGTRALYKIPYTISETDAVALGVPVNLLEADAEGVGDRVEFVASKVAFGQDAQALLDEVTEKNPLLAALKGSPNTHLVVFDLTSVGRPSKHAGKVKYQLATKGLEAALPTLITKPIHVTTDFDAHFEAGRAPKPIGVFLGGVGLENEDGTMTLRAIGTLWNSDFPEEVEEIQKKKAELGASYEIAYLAASAERIGPNVIEIGSYEFSGGAILKKTAAAHPETQLLVASKDADRTFDVLDEADLGRLLAYLGGATSFTPAVKLSYAERPGLKDSDFALVQAVDGRKVRRFPIDVEAHRKSAWDCLSHASSRKNLSAADRVLMAMTIMARAKSAGDDWAGPYTKVNGTWVMQDTKEGGAMPKYTGIPAEMEAAVNAIIEQLKAEHQKELDQLKAQAEEQKKTDEVADLKAELETEKGKVVELTNQVTALTAERDGIKAELQAKSTQLAEKEEAEKLAATIGKLKADYGLTDDQLKEPARLELAKKQAAAKEPLSMDEFTKLIAGAKVRTAGGEVVPLMAGSGGERESKPDAAAIGKNFPAATQVRLR